jgi:hypothetical protein
LAAVAVVIGLRALNTVLIGCDTMALGLGRPLCVQEEQGAEVVLVISSAALVIGLVAAVIGQRRAHRN